MGVPSFYKWLIERYPLILQEVIEEEPLEVNGGVTIPVDTSKPNPNGYEYDNLYLDMNGIIHPCFHPEDKPSPTTFTQVFQCMFDYIDRLFVMVRPRKLLFMAIDGVAPRAKMNQQRARRFRAAKDAAEAAAEEEQLRQEFEREGKKLPRKVDSQVFDSNVITPGTEFMSTLSFALRYYIHIRLNSDPGWKNIKVILSDANVPGEGEHKIMSYIRCNKNHPGYNPNTHHCLYGLDADLIMLSLATHEIHFSILREVVFFPGEQDKCFLCGQMGHRAADCEGKIKRKAGEMLDNTEPDVAVKKPYEFVNIWILREYLEHDMQKPNKRSKKNLDRLIDDFIFICFFVGNDFLPHMPTLEIREGAIELLMSVYRSRFSSAKKYLTDASKLNLSNVERFIQAVGMYENKIFLKRELVHQRQSERFCRDKARNSAQASRQISGKLVQLDSVDEVSDSLHSSPPKKYLRLSSDDNIGVTNVKTENSIKTEELDNGEDLKFKLKKLLRNKADVFSSGNGEQDKVRLGVSGWRERYYEEKFTAKSVEEMEQIRRDVVLKYTEGLCWIMHNYYHGVCSWKWFYPYHYAPFASDLKGLDRLDIKFELGSPFKPFNQLLSVLPSASAHALPECYRTLMTDPDSAIADFYPVDFEIDMNGKRYSWQGIAKLPFVDERRLLETVALVEKSLTTEEIRRNSVLFDMLFVVASHPLAELIRSLNSHTKNLSSEERATIKEKIDPGLSDGMNGYIASCGGDSQPLCFSSPVEGMEDVLANQVICAIYKLPEDIRGSEITHQIPSLVIPKKTINLVDLKGEGLLWHEDGDKRRAPARIIKTKRYNPEGSISGDRLGKAAHRLVLQTVNAQPDNAHINTEPALCPNTVFQNQRASEKIPAFEENKIQWVSPQSQITPKKMKSPQSQNTWKKKRSSKRLEDLKKKNPLSVIPLKMKKSKTPRGKKKENQIPQTKPTKKQRRAIHLRMVEEARKRKEQKKIKIAKKAQIVPKTLELRSRTLPRSSSTR
ncbi:PREDICTED: 5'-3' exoribonuclease 2 [Camelina sativa]|uniref:5'-3' exoribonuclease n=1 Tax=Camelina sativa TaxID=90675 RepID=A0ABM0UJS4_CAMSA|nr:PREDICTED: 5'-3' exoribonuclease 2 [Camelina sativa]